MIGNIGRWMDLPEIAFLGRSNVGKSSLINSLLGSAKGLARTSNTPGRTQSINFFLINEDFLLRRPAGLRLCQGFKDHA